MIRRTPGNLQIWRKKEKKYINFFITIYFKSGKEILAIENYHSPLLFIILVKLFNFLFGLSIIKNLTPVEIQSNHLGKTHMNVNTKNRICRSINAKATRNFLRIFIFQSKFDMLISHLSCIQWRQKMTIPSCAPVHWLYKCALLVWMLVISFFDRIRMKFTCIYFQNIF